MANASSFLKRNGERRREPFRKKKKEEKVVW
jgi:hypothetical protein